MYVCDHASCCESEFYSIHSACSAKSNNWYKIVSFMIYTLRALWKHIIICNCTVQFVTTIGLVANSFNLWPTVVYSARECSLRCLSCLPTQSSVAESNSTASKNEVHTAGVSPIISCLIQINWSTSYNHFSSDLIFLLQEASHLQVVNWVSANVVPKQQTALLVSVSGTQILICHTAARAWPACVGVYITTIHSRYTRPTYS